MNLEQKYNLLQKNLAKLGKVLIAYSGGVDSSFLLKVAADTLGIENVLACIDAGPSLPKSQYKIAMELAVDIGVDIQTIYTGELDDDAYSANNADRCFHCKSHLYQMLNEIAKDKGFDNIICGTNLNDKDDYRPGNRAAKVLNVSCPLADAQLTKDDIRKLSRKLNLPTAAMPASPCLASRISYGLEITEKRLKQIEQAEDFLRQLGLVEFRVRHHHKIARIEVHKVDLEKIINEPLRSKIVEKFKSLGFQFVTVDLQGFRSGSLNEMLSREDKQKSL